jgi:hypothetical protein
MDEIQPKSEGGVTSIASTDSLNTNTAFLVSPGAERFLDEPAIRSHSEQTRQVLAEVLYREESFGLLTPEEQLERRRLGRSVRRMYERRVEGGFSDDVLTSALGTSWENIHLIGIGLFPPEGDPFAIAQESKAKLASFRVKRSIVE